MEEDERPDLSSSSEERKLALLSNTQDSVLGPINLEPGCHDDPEDGMSLMELVARIAGEEHSSYPDCTSPVLTDYCNLINDELPGDVRQGLIPLAPELAVTNCPHCEGAKVNTMLAHILREILCPALQQNGPALQAQGLLETEGEIRGRDMRDLWPNIIERTTSLTRDAWEETARTQPGSRMERITRAAYQAAVSAWDTSQGPPEIYQAICEANTVVQNAVPDHSERLQAHIALVRDIMKTCHHRRPEDNQEEPD